MRIGASAAPSIQDYGSAMRVQAGQELMQAGGQVSRVALQMQDDINRIKLTEAMNKVVEAETALAFDPQTGFRMTKGKTALEWSKDKSLDQDYGERFDKHAELVGADLSNDYQRKVFAAAVGQRRVQFVGGIQSHMAQQKMLWDEAVHADTVRNAGAIVANEPGQYDVARKSVITSIENRYTGEERKIRTREAMSDIAAIGVDRAVRDGNLDLAKSIFETALDNGDMMPSAVAAAKTQLKMGAVTVEAGKEARSIFKSFMTADKETGEMKRYHEEVPVEKINQALIEKFGDKPEHLAAARAEANVLISAWNKSAAEQASDRVNKVYGMRQDGVPLNQIRLSKAWGELPEQTQSNLWDAFTAQSTGNYDKHQRQLDQNSAGLMLDYMMNPEKVAALSNEQIAAMRPSIGDKNSEQLVRMRQAYAGNMAKLSQASMDTELFKSVAASEGFDAEPKKSDKKASLALLTLRNEVEKEIGLKQTSLKRELDRSEKETTMREVVQRKVKMNQWGSDPEVQLSSVPTKDLPNAYVVVTDPATYKQVEVNVGAIPPSERARSEAGLRARGLNPTPQAVVQDVMNFREYQRKKSVSAIPAGTPGATPSAVDQIPR